MARITYALITMVVIEMALYYFAGTSYSTTSLFNLLKDPASALANPLYLLIIAAMGLMVASQIIPGNFFQINIYGVYASVTVLIITFVASIFRFGTFLNAPLSVAIGPTFSSLIVFIICAPIGLIYIMACMEWMRFNN